MKIQLSNKLSEWVRNGNEFDVDVLPGSGVTVITLTSTILINEPQEALTKARKGQSATWQWRGYTLETMPVGRGMITKTRVIDGPVGTKRPFKFPEQKLVRNGSGQDFWIALENAFKATPTEID